MLIKNLDLCCFPRGGGVRKQRSGSNHLIRSQNEADRVETHEKRYFRSCGAKRGLKIDASIIVFETNFLEILSLLRSEIGFEKNNNQGYPCI